MARDLDPSSLLTMVRELLTERFGIAPEKMTEAASIQSLGLDSMLVLDIMLEMEDRLGIKLKNLTVPPNPTLDDLIAVIKQNLAAKT